MPVNISSSYPDNSNARISPVKKSRIADQVVVQLTRLILSGEYEAGSRLPPERDLAPQFSVTRTTLREAFRKMEGMGLIRVRQGDGVYVEDYSINTTLDFMKFIIEAGLELDGEFLLSFEEIRRFVATKIIELAAERAGDSSLDRLEELAASCPAPGSPELLSGDWDYMFYRELAIASGNRVFVYLINSIKDIFGMLRWLYSNLDAKQIESLAELNVNIVKALRQKNGKKAVGLVEKRMKNDEAELKAMIEGMGPEKFRLL